MTGQATTPLHIPAATPAASLASLARRVLTAPVSVPILAAALAFLIRITGLGRANELFVDELTYTRLATAAGRGQFPNLAGTPFFLHPPGDFFLNALAIKVFGLTGTTMDVVYDLRWISSLLGAVMVVLAYLLIRRLTNTPIAIVAAGVLAFDPFVLRNDTRVMLETPTTVLLLAGWLLLATTLTKSARPKWTVTAAAGALLGLAVVTKDLAIVPVVVPLVLAIFWRKTISASRAGVALAAAATPYLIYLVILLASGLLGQWAQATAFGVRRMIGLDQITGFNAPGAPSIWTRLLDQMSRFGTSYLLIIACVVAGALAAFSANRARRLTGLTAVVLGVLGLYAATAGALEEQFGYYVVVISVIACAAATADLIERRPSLRRTTAIIGACFLALTIVLGVTARLTTDDGFRQARAWMNSNLNNHSRVGLTDVTAEFAMLPHAGYGVWPSLRSLAANHAQYVLTRSQQLSQGYGYAAPQLLPWLITHATPVFTAHGPTSGQTTVWRLNQQALRQALTTGNTIPPITGNYH